MSEQIPEWKAEENAAGDAEAAGDKVENINKLFSGGAGGIKERLSERAIQTTPSLKSLFDFYLQPWKRQSTVAQAH